MSDIATFMKIALASKKFAGGKPVPIVPFKNWDYYYIIDDLEWHSDPNDEIKFDAVKVPKGFVTDLASIPSIFWTILPPMGPYAYPAIVHDYLYWFQPSQYSRDDADQIFRLAMLDMNVAGAKVVTIFEAVRLGGGLAWESNKAARIAGEKRVLTKFPEKATISWEEWKQEPDVFAH